MSHAGPTFEAKVVELINRARNGRPTTFHEPESNFECVLYDGRDWQMENNLGLCMPNDLSIEDATILATIIPCQNIKQIFFRNNALKRVKPDNPKVEDLLFEAFENDRREPRMGIFKSLGITGSADGISMPLDIFQIVDSFMLGPKGELRAEKAAMEAKPLLLCSLAYQKAIDEGNARLQKRHEEEAKKFQKASRAYKRTF